MTQYILASAQEQAMAFTRYGQLRNQLLRRSPTSLCAAAVLRDADSDYVPIPINERLVQCIWYDQRLRVADLKTVDGQPVRVLFQGWWNLEAGPDFLHATVQLGDEPERTGSIEIHLCADDWFHHGHDRDPHFNDVILHVVLWKGGSERAPRRADGQAIPQLVLEPHLDVPLESLYDEIDLDAYPHNARNHAGKCAHIIVDLPAASIAAMLNDAGDERFASKTRRFLRWIHRAGPAQAFYEGWMEALGYKANKLPFRTLAQRLPIAKPAAVAVFFGIAGFLTATSARDPYTKKLWRAWWKLRPEFEEKILPANAWRMCGVRPANHPHRRLGAAIALRKRHSDLMEKVLGALESDGDPGKLFAQIRDEHWSHHFTLGGKAQRRPGELIGAARAQEIVTNIVLPFAAAHARQTGNAELEHRVKARFDALKATAPNSILRLAGQQLFEPATAARRVIRTTRQQQGLMQIFQDFCLNEKAVCDRCRFPDLARQWAAGGG